MPPLYDVYMFIFQCSKMVSCDIFPTNLEYLPSYLWKKKSSAEIGCVISLIAQRLFPPFPSHPTHLIFRISSLICEITKRFHLLSVRWMSSICINMSAQVFLVYINLKCAQRITFTGHFLFRVHENNHQSVIDLILCGCRPERISPIVQKRLSPFYPPSTEICADPQKY